MYALLSISFVVFNFSVVELICLFLFFCYIYSFLFVRIIFFVFYFVIFFIYDAGQCDVTSPVVWIQVEDLEVAATAAEFHHEGSVYLLQL